jgi:hypothetical protein
MFAPPSRFFTTFLAADFTNIESKIIKTFAKRLVDVGCVYFCIWGSDCKRAQGIIDEVCFDSKPAILTTSHPQDTLDKALWYFAFNEILDSKYKETGTSIVAVSISNTAWARSINRRLTNLDELNHDVMGGS